MHNNWHTRPIEKASADQLLAGSDHLFVALAHDQQPIVRWYMSEPAALVLGVGQRSTEIDEAACAAADIGSYRRSSGGAAVHFAPDFLMLDVALPSGHPLYLADVTHSYRWLGETWQQALAQLGITTRLVAVAEARSDTQALDPLLRRVCFGGRSPYEVLVGERKLVGFSQVRRRAGAVLQVGIYRSGDPAALTEFLALTPAERRHLATLLTQRTITLADLQPDPPQPQAIMAAFQQALEKRMASSAAPYPL